VPKVKAQGVVGRLIGLPRIAGLVGTILHEPAFSDETEIGRVSAAPSPEAGNRNRRTQARRNDCPQAEYPVRDRIARSMSASVLF
jgi:alkylated DNA nucleotide flippase Atl1